jgi:hypothetical protein
MEINVRRINVVLPPKLAKQVNDYCIAYAKKKGHYPKNIKQLIARAAVKEWMGSHGKDLTAIDNIEEEE